MRSDTPRGPTAALVVTTPLEPDPVTIRDEQHRTVRSFTCPGTAELALVTPGGHARWDRLIDDSRES